MASRPIWAEPGSSLPKQAPLCLTVPATRSGEATSPTPNEAYLSSVRRWGTWPSCRPGPKKSCALLDQVPKIPDLQCACVAPFVFVRIRSFHSHHAELARKNGRCGRRPCPASCCPAGRAGRPRIAVRRGHGACSLLGLLGGRVACHTHTPAAVRGQLRATPRV